MEADTLHPLRAGIGGAPGESEDRPGSGRKAWRAPLAGQMNRAARTGVWLAMRHTLLAFTILLWLAGATTAAADCEPAGPIDEALPDAPIAFVGTVTAVDGPIATFAVGEVWAGAVAEVVTVRGLNDGLEAPDGNGAAFSEDDRHWSNRTTYLVVPFVDNGVLRDNQCTATTEWRPELEELRPADARILAGGESTVEYGPPAALLLIAAVALLVLAASVLAFRRR